MTVRKIEISFILTFAFLFFQRDVFGNDFKLYLTYVQGEKSRDSYTLSTKISIEGNQVTYSKTSSGYIRSKLENEDKSCMFSKVRLDSIINYIITNKLNVTDSLFDESIKYKSYELFTNITLDIENEEINSHIRINGDVSQFENQLLYKNLLDFISYLNDLIENC
jgi:hypothetical protein